MLVRTGLETRHRLARVHLDLVRKPLAKLPGLSRPAFTSTQPATGEGEPMAYEFDLSQRFAILESKQRMSSMDQIIANLERLDWLHRKSCLVTASKVCTQPPHILLPDENLTIPKRAERLPFQSLVEIHQGSYSTTGQSLDISLTGIKLCTAAILQLDHHILLMIEVPESGKVFRIPSRVIRQSNLASALHQFALEF